MALSVAQQRSRRESFGITCHYLAAFNSLNYVVFLIVDVAHESLVKKNSPKSGVHVIVAITSALKTQISHRKTGLF